MYNVSCVTSLCITIENVKKHVICNVLRLDPAVGLQDGAAALIIVLVLEVVA